MPNIPWVPWHELGSLSHWSAAFVSSLPSKRLDGKKNHSLVYIIQIHMEVTSNTTPKNGPLPSFTQKRKQLGVTAAERKRICLLCSFFFFKRHFVSTQHKTNNSQAEPEKQSWLFGRHLRLRLRWGGYESSRSVDEGPSRAVVSWSVFPRRLGK